MSRKEQPQKKKKKKVARRDYEKMKKKKREEMMKGKYSCLSSVHQSSIGKVCNRRANPGKSIG
jgi:hypothetical protein